jgi:SHAQKYF class myb-like DNA-binding protein
MTNGIWSEDEHDRFLTAIKQFPRGPWAAIAQAVGTRSVRQVQTHTQKYYEKIMRRVRGLRKDRKTWARVEHRIDDDILQFCDLLKTNSAASVVVSPPNVMQKPIVASTDGSTDSSTTPLDFSCVVADAELGEDCLELDEPLDQPLDLDDASAMELPPLEEALDFLIALME